MKMRAGPLVTCAASALAIGLGFASPVLAADTMPTKAPVPIAPAWWYEGFAEIAGRFFLNDPDKRKLGKFYEYRDLRPGVFGNFFVGAHRTGPDPLDIEAWGKNIGWDDQAFGLDIYKPGTYYLTLGWDETPHFVGTGRTTFSGGNVLSTPCYPTGAGNVCGGGGTPTANANTNAFVNANSHDIDLKFRRDTANTAFRWTPTDNWDVNVDYSHMHREGTQPLSAVTFTTPAGAFGPTRASTQLPKPLDDTTQNGNVKGEYAGSTPWGKPFNVAFGYGVSLYNNDVGCGSVTGFRPPGSGDANCLTFQNPWTAGNAGNFPGWNRYSLPPDNQAHALSASGGVGLPFNSRYMGTFQYSWMEQNETFLTSNINPLAVPAVLPRSSLDGDARTTLANNVLNTQITSELTSTLRYRYYDYHSNQAPVTLTGLVLRPDTTNGVLTDEIAHPVNFTKQNASGELVYRPWKWLNVGAIYEWEQWRHAYGEARDVVTLQEGALTAVTNENSVKAFADVKTWGWSTLRASVRFGERRLDGNYINPIDPNNDGFRTVDLQDRDSTIVRASWDINVTSAVTVTPSGGYRLDDYPANGVASYGITQNESWDAGADVSWVITPSAALYVSYMHENGVRDLFQRNLPSTLFLHTQDVNDVFIVGGKFTVIPQTLFFDVNYAYSRGTSRWSDGCGPGGCFTLADTPPVANPLPTFPDIHNTNHRVDAQAKYMLDPTWLRSAGFLATAQPYVKFRVIYEKNSNDSWQNVEQQLGWAVNPADTTTTRAVFLGIPNPNYDVVVGMASFGVKW